MVVPQTISILKKLQLKFTTISGVKLMLSFGYSSSIKQIDAAMKRVNWFGHRPS